MADDVPSLGIVIPTRNAAAALSRLLPALKSEWLSLDIMISDGGSEDASVDLAARHGARVTAAEGGRGPQLAAGARAVLGDWILFLHADSRLPRAWDRIIADFMDAAGTRDCAGYFRFALDDPGAEARRLERMVAWRCRVLGLPYGDQGLLIPRAFLDRLGGVPELPLMEDVALVRRIGKRRLVPIEAALTTSSEKFRRDGYLWRSARNLICLALYFLRVPSAWIRRLYG